MDKISVCINWNYFISDWGHTINLVSKINSPLKSFIIIGVAAIFSIFHIRVSNRWLYVLQLSGYFTRDRIDICCNIWLIHFIKTCDLYINVITYLYFTTESHMWHHITYTCWHMWFICHNRTVICSNTWLPFHHKIVICCNIWLTYVVTCNLFVIT